MAAAAAARQKIVIRRACSGAANAASRILRTSGLAATAPKLAMDASASS